MPDRTQPLTEQQLTDIETRAASLYEYATLTDVPLQAEADQLTGEDVPALLAEVRQLRAAAEAFRSTFGNVIVRSKDGDWANVADFIATGARIPVCDAFYPHHTDTRCTRAKGHCGGHLAPWGTRDMAWPRDPRETQPDPICGDENDGDHCELEPGHDGHHCADTAEWAAAPAAVETGE